MLKKPIKSPDGNWTFSAPIKTKLGFMPQMIAGVEYLVLIAVMSTSDIFLDPENNRVKNENDKNKFKTTKNGQKLLKETLTGKSSKRFKKSADRLKASMEYHGGQNEAIWVQQRNGKTISCEGNRRRAMAEELGWETMICYVFPDEMPESAVNEIVSQRHVAGIQQWDSAIRSYVAYSMVIEQEKPIEEVVALLSFSTIKEAEKYIHAYVWLEKSGLSLNQWSKFHHAFTPTLIRHFGYNKATCTFEEKNRQPARKNALLPEEIDEKIAVEVFKIDGAKRKNFKTNFNWFVNLIKENKVTDCRHSDGIVAPAIREIDEPHGLKVMRLLNSKPSARVSQSEDDGKGRLNPNSPAQQAWDHLKSVRDENHIVKKTEALSEAVKSALGSQTKLSKYKKVNLENELLKREIGTLITLLKQFEVAIPEAKNPAA